jgi:hypothetical protein
MKIRNSDDAFFRESFRLPRSEARKRAKQLFSEFPSATYMTEIETWRECEGIVDFQMKRLIRVDPAYRRADAGYLLPDCSEAVPSSPKLVIFTLPSGRRAVISSEPPKAST